MRWGKQYQQKWLNLTNPYSYFQIKKDRVFNQCFKDMLSYPFFKRITDVLLEDVSAASTREPGGRIQCTKVAFAMEAAARLTAVDNHPMNVVLGFGLKYLREHFKPWIQDQGGWVCVLPPLPCARGLRHLEAAHLHRTNMGQMQPKPNCTSFNTACTPAVELLAVRHLCCKFFYLHRSKNK